VSSRDGFCSLIQFEAGELGEIYNPVNAAANKENVKLPEACVAQKLDSLTKPEVPTLQPEDTPKTDRIPVRNNVEHMEISEPAKHTSSSSVNQVCISFWRSKHLCLSS